MNINKLHNHGLIKPTTLYGKHVGLGRSYGVYELKDIPAGTSFPDRTFELPTDIFIGTDPPINHFGDTPTAIKESGCAPWTYVFNIDVLDENLIIDATKLQTYFIENELWEASIDIWVQALQPGAGIAIEFENSKTNKYPYVFGTLEYLRITCFMARRLWIDPTGAQAELMPTYRKPRL